MIEDFRALLDTTQVATPHMTIYNSTQEFIKHKSHYKTYISDDQQHGMQLFIYHGIMIELSV